MRIPPPVLSSLTSTHSDLCFLPSPPDRLISAVSHNINGIWLVSLYIYNVTQTSPQVYRIRTNGSVHDREKGNCVMRRAEGF